MGVAWGIGCGEDGTPGAYASVSKELTLEITAPSMDTLATFVKLGWTGKYQIFRGREMELGNMAGSLRDRFKDSHNARSTGESLRPHSLTFQTMEGQLKMGMKMLILRRVWGKVSLQ